MQWVGTSTTMTLGAFISVRTFVTTHKTVLATLQVLKQDGGSEVPPQVYLYDQEVFKHAMGRNLHLYDPVCIHKCQNICNNT